MRRHPLETLIFYVQYLRSRWGLESYLLETLKPPEPFVVLPKRMHTVTISTKDIDNADRFTFEGETPFSSTTMNANDVITVGVSTDLSTIKNDKSSSFVFQSSDDKPDSLVTITIMHDLSSNIIFTTIKPAVDTLTQSFDAEGQDPNMYQLPEYFFEGFPDELSLEITSENLSLLSCSINSCISDCMHFSKLTRRPTAEVYA